MGGRVARRLRRRRRGPDDLHVRRRVAALPRDVRRRPPRGPGRRAHRELPLDAGDPRPREPPPLERRTPEAPDRHPPERAEADRSPATRPTRRSSTWLAGRIRELIAGGTPPAGDRRPRPDQRPARADRGRADPGRHRVPRPGRRVLPPAGRPGGDRPRPPIRTRRAPRDRRLRRRSAKRGRASWASRRTTSAATRRASGRRRWRRWPRSSTISWRRRRRSRATTSLAELARRSAAEQAATEAGDGTGGVELATYHRAKGLEWDAVFLPMLEEGSLPIRQALDDEAALEEERRLLYVGITRARVHLALSWADRRDARGGAADDLAPATESVPRRAGGRPDRGHAAARGTRPRDRAVRDPRGPPTAPRKARSWPRCASGDGGGRRTTTFRRTSSPTTRRSARSPRPGPTTLAALGGVKGMGPTKLDRYGDGDPRGDRLGGVTRAVTPCTAHEALGFE